MKKNGFVFLGTPWKSTCAWMCLMSLLPLLNDAYGYQGVAPNRGVATQKVKPEDAQKEVDGLKTKLVTLNEQLTTIEAEINGGEGDLEQLQNKYRDTLDEVNQTIETLKASCLIAIQADPGNQKNIQTVMGILLNDAAKGDDREVLITCDRLIAAGIHPAYFEYAARAGRIKIGAREIFDEALIRLREAKADDLPRVLLKTSKGEITLELYENEAPQTVGNFLSLVEDGFYDDCLFHSVIESFRAQSGGPTRNDASRQDPGYSIYCECYQPAARPHFTDVLSMAVKSSRDTGASQFIITLNRTTELDGKHTVFGRVIDGHEVTDQLVRTAIEINGEATDIPNSNPDYIISAEVIRKRDHGYKFRKVGDPEEEKETPLPPPTVPETKSFNATKSEDQPAVEAASKEAQSEAVTDTASDSDSKTAGATDARGKDAENTADADIDSTEENTTSDDQ